MVTIQLLLSDRLFGMLQDKAENQLKTVESVAIDILSEKLLFEKHHESTFDEAFIYG